MSSFLLGRTAPCTSQTTNARDVVEKCSSEDSEMREKNRTRKNTQADDRHRIMLVEITKILQDDKLNGMVNYKFFFCAN
jgi:hypothetical protein